MAKGLRKLIMGITGICAITAVAIVTKDSATTAAAGGGIGFLILGLVWGYRKEYN